MDSKKAVNTNKTLSILLAVLLLSVRHAVCAPQEYAPAVQMSREQMAHLETNIAHAIVWQLYWCEGKTPAQLRKQVAKSQPTPYTLCRVENEDLCVYLDDYQWKIVLTEIGGEHYDFDVVDYKMQAGNAADHRSNYMEALKNEPAILTKSTLTLRPEHLSVLTFAKPGEKQYSVITNTLTTNLLGSESLKVLREQMAAYKTRSPLVVHVGGFNGQSPWVYYTFQGMPFVGMMLVDPSSGEFIHDDLLYIHENAREAAYEKMQRIIDKSGTKFSLNLPAQTAKAENP